LRSDHIGIPPAYDRPVPTLTAIVPATDGPATLERCLAAIAGAEDPPEEVVVVDAPPGAGPAAARNAGARRARGDVLVFVDADVEPHGDAFARLRERLDGSPGLAAVFGSYDDDPGDPGLVSAFRNLLHHHVHQGAPGAARTFWAGLGAVRREPFLAAGGFDEGRYPTSSIEDIELGGRLVAAGETIELDPAVQGRHLKRWTLRSMLVTDFSRRGVPWVALLLRGGGAPVLNLGVRHRASAAAAVGAVVAAFTGRLRTAALAVAVLTWLNRDLYALVARRRGPVAAAAAVPLHALHHLAGAAAVPAGVVVHVRERRVSAD
jgi:GT2 family glycosyltransferase